MQNFRPSDYVFAQAFGEVCRLLPLEVQATQNIAARRGLSRGIAWIDDDGVPHSIFEVHPELVRELIVERVAELDAARRDQEQPKARAA